MRHIASKRFRLLGEGRMLSRNGLVVARLPSVWRALLVTSWIAGCCSIAYADALQIQGQVLDLNGAPVRQAQVTLNVAAETNPATATTIFTDQAGRFAFSDKADSQVAKRMTVEARALGYRQLSPTTGPAAVLEHAKRMDDKAELLFVMQQQHNRATTAP